MAVVSFVGRLSSASRVIVIAVEAAAGEYRCIEVEEYSSTSNDRGSSEERDGAIELVEITLNLLCD